MSQWTGWGECDRTCGEGQSRPGVLFGSGVMWRMRVLVTGSKARSP